MIMKRIINFRILTFVIASVCAGNALASGLASQSEAALPAEGSSDPKEVKSVTTTIVTTRRETVYLPVDSLSHELADSIYTQPREGGQLMWVPDSLKEDVKILLKGHSRVVDDPMRLDMNEKVVFRGDTVPMVLRDRNLGRYDRGLFNFLFIPKGTWHFGLTASYGEISTSDLQVLDLVSDIDLGAHTFSIKPYVSYFMRNNLSVGLRMNYTRSVGDINSLKMDIDEDMNFNLHDIHYRSESYAAAIFMQQYMGITRRGRFGIYNEIELSFASGNSDFNRPYNGEIRKTHTTSTEARLTFSPGVCVFVMENVSFNVSFGVFGFHLKNEKQIDNGEDLGNRFTSGANFKINLFNLSFGIGIHI